MSLETLQDHWALEYELGLGTFSKVFSAVDKGSGLPVVVKYPLHAKGAAAAMLEKEAKTMSRLQKCKGIPKLLDATHTPEYIVMEKVGKTLLTLKGEGKISSAKTVIMVGLKVIDVLEDLHNYGYIHKDIKPDNIAISLDPADPTIYLIDLGLSRKYINSGIHTMYSEREEFVGTPYFASLNCVRGVKPSRRDDLEALGYVLLFFLRGSLPWFSVKAGFGSLDLLTHVLAIREKYSARSLCLPSEPELAEYFTTCQNLGFAENPDYDALRLLFHQWGKRLDIIIDWIYDWTPTRHSEHHGKARTVGGSHSPVGKHSKRRMTTCRMSPSKNMSSLDELSPPISPGQKIESLRRFSIQLHDSTLTGSSSTDESSPDLVKTPVHSVDQLPSFSTRPRIIIPIGICEDHAPKTAMLPDIEECEEKQPPKRQRRYTCDEFDVSEKETRP